MKRALIVEDEPRIAAFVDKGLRSEGFATALAADGTTALEKGLSGEFDLVILDLGLPDMDGLDVLKEMRRWDTKVAMIVLTARDGAAVAALDAGADDYLAKPFSFDELLARIRARLRDAPVPESTLITEGDCSLDLRTRTLNVTGKVVELTAREFALAELFFRNTRQVLSRQQILSHVWGYDYEPDSNVVDVYVGYLRKKLGKTRLVTVRGMGYRFDPN
ncbi:MAG: response regulator transcription factor [Acidimicrobiia bacterium]